MAESEDEGGDVFLSNDDILQEIDVDHDSHLDDDDDENFNLRPPSEQNQHYEQSEDQQDGEEEEEEEEDEELLEDNSVQAFFSHTDAVYTVSLHPTDPNLAITGGGRTSFLFVEHPNRRHTF
jgi:ribosome assembly protein SQT1